MNVPKPTSCGIVINPIPNQMLYFTKNNTNTYPIEVIKERRVCMPNPLITLREERGLSRTNAAIAFGIAYGQLAALEAGRAKKIGPVLRGRLEGAGVDVDFLQDQLDTWHQEQAQVICKGLSKAV